MEQTAGKEDRQWLNTLSAKQSTGFASWTIFLVDGEVRTESVALVRDIEKLPAADVAPVRHGVWLTWEDMFPGETPKKKNNLGGVLQHVQRARG